MEKENKNPISKGSENIALDNKELFNDLFGKSIIATLFYDKMGKLISANQSALNVFRIPDLSDIGNINLFNFPWIDLDHKNKLEREGFVEFQPVINIEFIKEKSLKSEGSVYTIWTIKRLNSGYFVQIQDITGQKQAESVLHESEKRYGELFNNPLNAFVILETVIDNNGKPVDFILIEANTTFEKLTGFKVEEVIYKRITEFAPEVEIKDIIEIFANVAITGKPAHFEQYFSQMDRYFDIAAFLPRKRQLTVFFADITDRKLVEEKLQDTLKHLEIEKRQLSAIIENIPVGVIIAEAPSGKFLLANKQIAEIWRYPQTARADEFKKYIGFHPDGSPYKTYEWPLSRSIRTCEVVKDEEIEILRGDGTKGWLSVSSVPILDDEGNIIMGAVIDLDITERKQAEEELKKSRERLESIIQGSPVLTFIIDKNHNVIHWNKAIEEYSGIKAEEVIGTENQWKALYSEKRSTMVDLLIDGDFERVSELYSGKYKRSEIVEGAYEIEDFFPSMGKNGRWLRATVSTIKDSKNNVIGAMEILEDTTERKQAEEKLKEARDNLEEQVKERTAELEKAYDAVKESEEKFRELFNKATDTIVLSEVKENGMPGRFVEVNEAASNVLGYNRNEWKNMTPLDLFAPERQEELPQISVELQKKGYATFESVSITKNRRKFPVEVNVHVFKLKGKDVALAIARDITERKQAEKALRESEEKLNATIESSPDSITVTDLDLNIVSCNQATVVMYGVSSKDEIIGLNAFDLVDPKDQPMLAETMGKILSENRSVTLEINLLTKMDNRFFPAEVSGNVIRDAEGKPIAFVAITKDITERKNAEKERETLINELKRSNEELQQFAYVASHDLQEPLRTIASFTQLLARRYKGQIDTDADEFIDFIVDGTQRMQAMIKDLLQYSRVQTKGEEFRLIDVQNALNQSLSNLKVSIEENNAEITHDKLPTVIADEKQLIQLFQNLISNAIKFKKPDVPPKIHISARKDEEKGEYIFGISDNGIGMEPQYLERIFELFQRLHTRDEYKGTGIGLAVAKKIVDRHGGRVWVESEPGKGSTFYFTIHLKEESEG